MDRVGILYRPYLPPAESLAQELLSHLQKLGLSVWLCSAWEEEAAREQVADSKLVFSVGGDGTILRSARIVCPRPVPIVGVNLGRVGFMSEVDPNEVFDRLPGLLRGEGWVEERAMLQAELPASSPPRGRSDIPYGHRFSALNDVVVGRGRQGRLVRVTATIDGQELTAYRADAVIVATATGSTGYSLAAGGPVLHPSSLQLVLTPVAPHLSLAHSLVLPEAARVELKVTTDHEAMISIDGQIDFPLESGDTVRVRRSPHLARFLRVQPPGYFYRALGGLLS